MTDAKERLDIDTCLDGLQVALHNQRYEFVLRQIPQTESILEVGTGLGMLSPRLAARCQRYTGVDFDPQSCEAASRRLAGKGRVLHADARKLPFDPRSFSAIVCLEVLEHLGDFKAGLSEIHRCLAPQGLAVISVPYRKSGGPSKDNAYHLYEPGEDELAAWLKIHFHSVEILYQYFEETPWMQFTRVFHLRRLTGIDKVYRALSEGEPEAVSHIKLEPRAAGLRLHLVTVARDPIAS